VVLVTAPLLLVGAAVAGLAVTGHLPGRFGAGGVPGPTPSATPLPPPAGPVLATSATSRTTVPRALLRRLLHDPSLGVRPGAEVLDVRTGSPLLKVRPGTALPPASLSKLATCTAALETMDAGTRLRTRVVRGARRPGVLVLVGGGDPTLSVNGHGAVLPGAARLSRLADRTVAALPSDTVRVRVQVDDSLFRGPSVAPSWEPGYVGAGVASPVDALSVDEGRVDPRLETRESDPSLAAGADFARLLARRGLRVTGPVSRTVAPADGIELAAVRSPRLSTLVEHTLSASDNDMAEALARLAAHAAGAPASFAGARRTITHAVTSLGVPTPGLRLLDGSGLSRGSRIAPVTVARLLLAATTRSRLAPLLSGLGVGGYSGSVLGRFDEAGARAGRGTVRAKTGTLTGVSNLAGFADDGTGRPVVFVLLADDVSDTLAARDTLDRLAAALARPPR
jgi:D-alanyl-D-alanine carboxypeptidase/D-alanyl-D-alanine-endopeptidase (penicillin-binding protein 4)